MAVVFDPHQNEPGNKILNETATVTGTKYRMLVPAQGPFYSHTLVVKSGTTELKLGNDYLITHPYMTAMSRTGRSAHGMVLVVNPAYTSGFTLSYHALGIGKATPEQISAERAANGDVFPSKCQWEQVIGELYFPPVDIQFDWDQWKAERELMQAIADLGAKLATPNGDNSDVLTLLKQYHAIVDKIYRDAPAHPHVADTANPHQDASYGRMRTVELNGIADDTTLVSGRNQANLTDYVNQRSAKASDFSDKMQRVGAAPRTITGTFTMIPGLASVTSAKGNESDGVGSSLQVDDKVIRLLSRDSTTINAGTNPITFKGGNNSLVLYPDNRGFQWNGKKLLDPTTVGPYIPGNEGGGSGVFYGVNSNSVTIVGSGIQTMPFICTYVPPDDSDLSTNAYRQLTNDFGNSESLAATPALIQKLANAFVGKLEMAKAYINGIPLLSSVTLGKSDINLANVENIADLNLPVSSLQNTEFRKYAQTTHTHTADAFGIGNATTAKAGLVKFGGPVDDATLALDGQYVLPQFDAVSQLEALVAHSDAEAVINIIRYGQSGSSPIDNLTTINGWMVTVKPNNYFLGQDYTVPVATFNLTELFPDKHEDTVIGVFVDLIDNAARYVLNANPAFGETDTLTKIGEIFTSETGIDQITIRNVTRLGEFRELEEHAANVNAHTPRQMTEAQFGFNFGRNGADWRGFPGHMVRGDSSWRMVKGESFVPITDVDYNPDSFLFAQKGSTVAAHKVLLNMGDYYATGGINVEFSLTSPVAASVLEVVLMSFVDRSGRRQRLSLLINRTNFITASDGSLCYAALAINYGTSRQYIIAINGTKYTTGWTWSALNPRVSFAMSRDPNGAPYVTGTLTLTIGSSDVVHNFTLQLAGMPTFSVTGPVNQSVSITTYLSLTSTDISDVVSDPAWPIQHGVGGIMATNTVVKMSYDNDGQFQSRYATGIALFNGISDVRRFRVITGDAGVARSVDALQDKATNDDFASAVKRPAGIPDYLNKERAIVTRSGTTYRAVIIRE